jgi:hypothetical protein
MRRLIVATALALAAGGLTTPVASAQAGAPWLVTIHVDTAQATMRHTFRFTGKVTPRAPAAGLKVVLQKKRAGMDKPWRAFTSDKIDSRGHYLLKSKPTANTVRKYRVVVPASAAHARGVSSVLTVKVYGWSRLTLRPSVNQSFLDPVASVSIAGVDYPASLEARIVHPDGPITGSVEFGLDGQCIAFRGTFGLSDSSDEGAEAYVAASADGVEWFSEAFAGDFTRPNSIMFKTPPLKIGFETGSYLDGLDGLGAVGTPKVLCIR